MSIPTIEAEELSKWILENKKDFQVIDVRDADFEGGNIKNAINIPSVEFKANVDKYVKIHSSKPILIFHCMMSQIRGPSCALKFNARANDLGYRPAVFVLRGGFAQWERKYGLVPELTENYDHQWWNEHREYD